MSASPKSLGQPLMLSKVPSQNFRPDRFGAVGNGPQVFAGEEVCRRHCLIFIILDNWGEFSAASIPTSLVWSSSSYSWEPPNTFRSQRLFVATISSHQHPHQAARGVINIQRIPCSANTDVYLRLRGLYKVPSILYSPRETSGRCRCKLC